MITNYTVTQVLVLPPEDDTNTLTPAERQALEQRFIADMNALANRELERALYGGYAPPIDPDTVVSEQTIGGIVKITGR